MLGACSCLPTPASAATAPKPPASKTPPPKPKPKPPALTGYAARAMLAYEAMQANYYVPGTGLYRGEPTYSFLWPFSQALAAMVSLAHLPGLTHIPWQRVRLERGVHALRFGLRHYMNPSPQPAGEPTSTATGASTATTLPSYDGTLAPPIGPGGDSFYDDNEWVGIELVRVYELYHDLTALQQAQQIMAFVMAGWQTTAPNGRPLPCPGGVPFSNSPNNSDRNTVTDGPAAELGVQLYRITHEARYLQFAEQAYGWVRQCLVEPNSLYADHITVYGSVNRAVWSYNQGSMIGAGTLLYQATGDGAYLYQARQTAKAALAYFTYSRLSEENPFFVSVYFRNLLYLDSVTHDPPGTLPAREYVYYAWLRHRLENNLFAFGSPPEAQLLTQAAIVQIYALLCTPPGTYF
jgi:hypothetical protein